MAEDRGLLGRDKNGEVGGSKFTVKNEGLLGRNKEGKSVGGIFQRRAHFRLDFTRGQ